MSGSGWFSWNRSNSGLGGAARGEVANRTIERSVTEHPDGRREIKETITEVNVRESFVSARNTSQFRAAMKTYKELLGPTYSVDTPLHQLQALKSDIIRELENKHSAAVLPFARKVDE